MSWSTPARVAAFLAALAAVFALALGVGRLAEPVLGEAPVSDPAAQEPGVDEPAAAPRTVDGLAVTEDGFTLDLAAQRMQPGRQVLRFAVTGPDGERVTSYDPGQGRDLGLIVVRRDLVGYQDLRPELDEATGEWRASADLTPGVWRVLAEVDPAGGDPMVLGDDLLVPGDFAPVTLPTRERTTASIDGYDVSLDGALVPGDPATGGASELRATVSLAGVPVSDLDPVLGAPGHLVVLRGGDLATLRVRPEDGPDGPTLAFRVDVPSAGDYRIFLDFSHLGVVHTAAFTLKAAR